MLAAAAVSAIWWQKKQASTFGSASSVGCAPPLPVCEDSASSLGQRCLSPRGVQPPPPTHLCHLPTSRTAWTVVEDG